MIIPLFLFGLVVGAAGSKNHSKPHIIFILADDLVRIHIPVVAKIHPGFQGSTLKAWRKRTGIPFCDIRADPFIVADKLKLFTISRDTTMLVFTDPTKSQRLTLMHLLTRGSFLRTITLHQFARQPEQPS